MTKAELIATIADKANLTRGQARDALDAFTTTVVDSLKAGKDVRMVGFGCFTAVNRQAGLARNPRTGEQVRLPASVTCRFRIGESLKAALNA